MLSVVSNPPANESAIFVRVSIYFVSLTAEFFTSFPGGLEVGAEIFYVRVPHVYLCCAARISQLYKARNSPSTFYIMASCLGHELTVPETESIAGSSAVYATKPVCRGCNSQQHPASPYFLCILALLGARFRRFWPLLPD